MTRRRAAESGFTLIEVVVALAILSVAVVAAIQGFAQGLRLLKLAGDHQYATLLADQKAREIVTPKAGQDQGEDERGFAWETVTTEIPAPDLARDDARAPAWRVYQIAVRVRWSGREVELTTLRTAPAEAEEEATAGPPRARSGTPGTGAPTAPPRSRRR